MDAGYLEARESTYLASVIGPVDGSGWGLAFLDVSTGQFGAAEFTGRDARAALGAELAVLAPKEILTPDTLDAPEDWPGRLTRLESWTFEPARAAETLRAQFRVASLTGYGLDAAPSATAAAGALVTYLRDTQRSELTHVRDLTLRVASDALIIDPVTLRHLNVVEGAEGGR